MRKFHYSWRGWEKMKRENQTIVHMFCGDWGSCGVGVVCPNMD